MTVELLSSISDIALMAAILFLVVAVILFFAFKIPEVISELTGTRARRTIAAMEQRSAAEVRPPQRRADNVKAPQPMPNTAQKPLQQYDVKTPANTYMDEPVTTDPVTDPIPDDFSTEELDNSERDIDETVLEKTVYSVTRNGEMNVVSTSPVEMLVGNNSENVDFKVVYELGFFESTEIVE